jgi:hypothetical protein
MPLICAGRQNNRRPSVLEHAVGGDQVQRHDLEVKKRTGSLRVERAGRCTARAPEFDYPDGPALLVRAVLLQN